MFRVGEQQVWLSEIRIIATRQRARVLSGTVFAEARRKAHHGLRTSLHACVFTKQVFLHSPPFTAMQEFKWNPHKYFAMRPRWKSLRSLQVILRSFVFSWRRTFPWTHSEFFFYSSILTSNWKLIPQRTDKKMVAHFPLCQVNKLIKWLKWIVCPAK